MIVKLHLEREPFTLREMLDNPLMKSDGQKIVEGLLSALDRIQDENMYLRSLNPENITVSKSCDRLVFMDMGTHFQKSAIIRSNRPCAMPYSAILEYRFRTLI